MVVADPLWPALGPEMTLKLTAAPAAGMPLVVTVTATVCAVLIALVANAGDNEQATTGGGANLHLPALPAVKIAWISETDRARLKNSTSSMRPWKNRLGVPLPLFHDLPISTSRMLLAGVPLNAVVFCSTPST